MKIYKLTCKNINENLPDMYLQEFRTTKSITDFIEGITKSGVDFGWDVEEIEPITHQEAYDQLVGLADFICEKPLI